MTLLTLPIQKNQRLEFSDFTIESTSIESPYLKFSVTVLTSSDDPEIKAIWCESKNALYLVGGKIDTPKVTKIEHSYSIEHVLPKQFLLEVNINSLADKHFYVKIIKHEEFAYERKDSFRWSNEAEVNLIYIIN